MSEIIGDQGEVMKEKTIRVLSIEDNPADAALIREKLAEAQGVGWDLPRFEVEHVARLQPALECLDDGDRFDVVLSDLDLPDSRAGETVAALREHIPHMPLVVLTGREDDSLARESVHAGVQDYLYKNEATGSLLARTMMYAIERQEAHEELERRVDERTAELRQVNEALRAEIAERNQTEEALRESESRFRLAVLHSGIIFAQTDRDLRYTWIYNPHPDFAPQFAIGKRDDELADNESTRQLMRMKQKVLDTGQKLRQDITFPLSDGTRTYDTMVEPMRDDAGDVIGVATCALDITERKQTEDALQEARRQMQAFLDHSPALMSIFDRDGRYHLVNSATADVLGRPRKEIVGQTFADLFPPEMASTFMRRVKRIAEVQGPLVVDDQIVVGGEKRIFSTILFHLSQRDDEPMTFGSIATDVTARKEAEQALRTSERQFRSLFEEAQIGIALIDQDTRIRAANPFMCRWLGYSEEEIQRLSVSDITFPGDLQREQDLIQEMKQGKRDAVRLEKRYVRKNGEIVWGDLVTNVVQDDQGNFLFGLGTVVDITERKRAEEDLRDSQERLKLALHGGALGTWDWNVQTDEVRFNERWAEMVGYGLEELEPHLSTWENLVHPDDIPAVYEALNAHLEGKTPFYEAEFRMQHKSGEWVWVLDRGKVIERDGKGRPLRACGTHLDITERKRTEHAAQARLRIAEASATKSLEEIMQMTLNEIESLTNSEIGFYHFLMEDQETLALQTWSANTLENMCSAEGEGLHYSVSEAGVWADCIRERRPIIHNDYFSLPDRKGMPPGHTPVTRELALPIMREDRIVAVLGVGNKPTDYNERDVQIASLLADFSWEIVERKRAEAKLEHYAAELKRSNEDLEQFAYVVSHDLREPARMVEGYLELLEDRYQGQLDEKADKYIDHAVDGAERMQEMIKALLELSRIETEGKEPAPTDVEAVLERTLNVLGRAIEETEADVTHDPLPTVMADEAQLGLVFQNLIANAIKFRREDVPPRVHVSAEQEGGEWVFSVADNGIGIDPEQADRLFQIFQRLHTREEYEGLGIGLALCRRVVERHGGRIWVESEPGEGTNFFFTIPVRDVQEG